MQTWNKIKSNAFFKFLSSVKLAVPLLIILALAILAGTLVESRYNAEYAKLVVYDTSWFILLHVLLAVNIIFAALSRIPYKAIHTGFVITHIGLVTLLWGSWVTYKEGIDGMLSVQEGQSSSSVIVNERVIELIGDRFFKKMKIERSSSERNIDSFMEINSHFGGLISVNHYYPFVNPPVQDSFLGGKGLAFNIKNNFFDENLFLPIESGSERSLGPAVFRLIPFGEKGFSSSSQKTTSKKSKRKPSSTSSGDLLVIKDKKSGKVVKEVDITTINKKIDIGGVSITVVKKFKNGVVVENKMVEGEGNNNPVLELEILSSGKKIREIIYARFPDFALGNSELVPFKFTFITSSAPPEVAVKESTELPQGHVPIETHTSDDGGGLPAVGSRNNIVEFQLLHSEEDYQAKLSSGQPIPVKVLLIKKDKIVSEKILNIGESFETPWMGMVLKLNSFQVTPQVSQLSLPKVLPAPELFSNTLPPSALVVKLSGKSDPIWLIEGQPQEVQIENDRFQIYYGKNIIKLPFVLNLDKFSKKDYLGTETAMSFESQVKVNSDKETVTISMNEPLKRDGYTLYQSSYQLIPNAPAVSIFSVNQDPGRWIKYLGSLILAIGIIIYTYMRSRLYRAKSQG